MSNKRLGGYGPRRNEVLGKELKRELIEKEQIAFPRSVGVLLGFSNCVSHTTKSEFSIRERICLGTLSFTFLGTTSAVSADFRRKPRGKGKRVFYSIPASNFRQKHYCVYRRYD